MKEGFIMKDFIGSDYDQKYRRPYFDTRASYGRKEDTIVFFYLVTPTGRYSKYWATLRLNAERTLSQNYKEKKLSEYIETLKNETFKNELKRGYKLSEPYLYSGNMLND